MFNVETIISTFVALTVWAILRFILNRLLARWTLYRLKKNRIAFVKWSGDAVAAAQTMGLAIEQFKKALRKSIDEVADEAAK